MTDYDAEDPSMARGKGNRTDPPPSQPLGSLATAELRGMFAEYNPRRMSEHDMAILKRSLQKFELVQPIVVNRRTVERGFEPGAAPVVVGGHQRIRAAGEIGIDQMDVRWVDLDQASERELNVVMNRNSGEFDNEMLAELLREIDRLGGELEMTGFMPEEFEQIMQDFSTQTGDMPDLRTADGFTQMTFVVSDAQAETIREAIARGAKHLSGPDESGNENRNGNALALICAGYDG